MDTYRHLTRRNPRANRGFGSDRIAGLASSASAEWVAVATATSGETALSFYSCRSYSRITDGPLSELAAHGANLGEATAVTVNGNGEWVVAAFGAKLLRWHLPTAEVAGEWTAMNPVSNVRLSGGGDHFVTAGRLGFAKSGFFQLWDCHENAAVYSISNTSFKSSVDISPAGDIVAVGHEKSVHVIDFADGTVLTSLPEPDAYVRFVSSGSSLLTISNPSWGPPAIRLRDAE